MRPLAHRAAILFLLSGCAAPGGDDEMPPPGVEREGAEAGARDRPATLPPSMVSPPAEPENSSPPPAEPTPPAAAPPATTVPPQGEPEPGVETCALTESGPVQAVRDGQVIENLRIVANGEPAIVIDGFESVTVRNCAIEHAGDHGLFAKGADGLVVEDVRVEHSGAPETGPHEGQQNNVHVQDSEGVRLERLQVLRGSSGVYMVDSPGAEVRWLEGHDLRGPFPRGQLLQWNRCDDSLLEDFSVENPVDSSWPEDNVSVYQSARAVVRRGLLDGNNSRTGVGVMFEQDGAVGATGLAEDIDAVRMGNGCFSVYPGTDVTFRRTRCALQFCDDQGRGAPPSNGMSWAAGETAHGNRILDSSYFDVCQGKPYWSNQDGGFVEVELEERTFEPRPPVRLNFCFD